VTEQLRRSKEVVGRFEGQVESVADELADSVNRVGTSNRPFSTDSTCPSNLPTTSLLRLKLFSH